jgi:hypothetical protein
LYEFSGKRKSKRKTKLRSILTSINNIVIEAFANHPRIEKCQAIVKVLKYILTYFIIVKYIYSIKRKNVLLSTLIIFPLCIFYACGIRVGKFGKYS